MAYHARMHFYFIYTFATLYITSIQIGSISTSSLRDGKTGGSKRPLVKNSSIETILSNDYTNVIFRDPEPFDSRPVPKPQRLKRSIYKEKIPRYLVGNTSPYSSIVYVTIGCVGTLISPMHVLTAAHCVHDGVGIRKGPKMKRLKIGMLRRNGKQHKIRVKKIFVSSEIKPTTESRFAYDYAILKLNRPHEKPYVKLKAAKGTVRSLSFYVFGRENKKRTSMYKFSHCQVMNRYDLNNFKIPFKDCPSSSGDSGSAVFESSGDKKAVIGLVSATAKYRSPSGGRIFATVVLRFTDFDIARINSWIAKS